jgi:hypothetical protein
MKDLELAARYVVDKKIGFEHGMITRGLLASHSERVRNGDHGNAR